MNCAWTKDNVVLYIYDELADDARYEFERHTQRCDGCRQELESALAFKNDLAEIEVEEISPNFLAASRLKLQEALETTEQSRGWGRLVFDFAGWMQQIKLAPALTAALLMIGFAGGSLTTYRIASANRQAPDVQPARTERADLANVAGIDSIVATDSNKVQINYNTMRRQSIEGTPGDPDIQKLLLLATRDTRNSGVRIDSIGLLGSKTQDSDVREALIYTLRYDINPGVRLEALHGLKGQVKGDVHVRDAVVEALMHDTNNGVRAKAIALLGPVQADMSVRQALEVLSKRDKDSFIRSESRRILANAPNLD